MVILFRSVLSVLIIFLIAIGSYADDKAQQIELLSKHFRLEKPKGGGPFPAVMLVPGCSGFDSETFASFNSDLKIDPDSWIESKTLEEEPPF